MLAILQSICNINDDVQFANELRMIRSMYTYTNALNVLTNTVYITLIDAKGVEK